MLIPSSASRVAAGRARRLLGVLLVGTAAHAVPVSAASMKAFEACLRGLEPAAVVAGLSPQRFVELTSGLRPDETVLERLNRQAEFILTTGEYMQRVVNPRRIEAGRELLLDKASMLAEIESRMGVRRETLLAIWGVETNYGTTRGDRDLLRSLATLSCFGRRQAFFRRELMASLQIVDAGHVPRESFSGSWAGAFGHTQFMPTTFLRMSVDFDGDGHRNLVDSVADALASTANYLVRNGWQTGRPWGVEVALPEGMVLDADSRKDRRALSDWTELGVTAVTERGRRELAGIPGGEAAALLRPDDAGGPVLLVFQNFNAVFAYNPSVKYALAINHLADRIAGEGPFETPWPASDRAVDHESRRELQRLLLDKGHRIGPVDGIIGPKTRAAIRTEQKRLGMTVDGRPSQALIQALGRRGG